MPATNVVLLEEARATREQAARVRRLMEMAYQPDVRAVLATFAHELDEHAHELELKAQEAVIAVSHTAALTDDLARTLAETQAKAEKLQQTAKRGAGTGDEGDSR